MTGPARGGPPAVDEVLGGLLGEINALRETPLPAGDGSAWGEALGVRRASLLDRLLRHLFAGASEKLGASAAALVAVGSYGRGAPALESDIDVRLLVEDPSLGQALSEAVLYPLWDLGLAIGHQVITLDESIELARTDLPTATSLLDGRFVAGDEALAARLEQDARARVFDAAGVERLTGWLIDEVQGRHERFGGSVYLLEPDVKSGEGGLRDLDVVGWLARAWWSGRSYVGLARAGVVAEAELALVVQARELLARVRNLLHRQARRRSDRLTFEMQEAVAPWLGYDRKARVMLAGRDPSDDELLGVAVEAFMSDYYRHAQVLARVLERFFRRVRPAALGAEEAGASVVPLGRGLCWQLGQVGFALGVELLDDPAVAFRLYDAAVRLGAPVDAIARERISLATHEESFCKALQRSPEAAALFRRLCAEAAETPQLGRSLLGELREVGLILAMIPEFSPVVGRVHHDIYHVYTVDVHSVAAVDRLKALQRGEMADDYPLACRLAAEVSQPEVLALATLLHDVGKALGGSGHSERGADMAAPIALRLGFEAAQADQIAHLVRTHLDMYHIATRRDLDDPATLDELHRSLRGPENLRELYLLTISDLSTTSPTALTAWKAKLLDDLYIAADARLFGGRELDDARVQKALAEVLTLTDGSAFVRSFLASMPARYLLANAPSAIASHIQVARLASRDGHACALRPASAPGVAELCVAALDRPGLLAAITAALVACRLEIHAAQILSHGLDDGRPQAVDLFWVRGPALEHLDRAQATIARELDAYISGRSVAAALSSRSSSPWATRRAPAVPTLVSIDDRSSSSASIVEVISLDRPGVLCALASAFHGLGLSISLAKINTEGARVADVFYVTDASNQKIELLPRRDEIQGKITDALAALSKKP